MSDITQCPTCNTRFRVSQEQLTAYQGLVRCGHCQAVFNAAEHLQDGEPSPQLDLPILMEGIRPASAISATQDKIEPAIPARQISAIESAPKPLIKTHRELWAAGCLILLILLLGQVAYFFRIELAATLPGLKPALTSYCNLLRCTVPLPQKAALVSIESSELEATDKAHPNLILLNALVRNHAPYTQAYPHLQLTLVDLQDKAVARRDFSPAEYLPPDTDENSGFPANREASAKLYLDTTDLKSTGYRLFLYYPQ